MSSSAAEPTCLRLDEALFANSLGQEAILSSWFAVSGARVEQGQRLAEILVEDRRHEIVAPIAGRLVDLAPACSILEPGDQLCRIAPGAAG